MRRFTIRLFALHASRQFLCWIILGVLLVQASAWAGSIFDDDWKPPTPAKPATPPADPKVSKPAKPPAPVKPDGSDTTPPQVGTQTPSVPAAPPARRAVPAAVEQAKSRKLFKEVFAKELADRSAPSRRALAAKLLEQADTANDAATDQFVLLVGATDAAREGSDLGLCCKAADKLAATYDVDALSIEADAAMKMKLRAETPDVTSGNCLAGLRLSEQLVAAEDYKNASRLLQALRGTSPEGETASLIQSRLKELDALRTATERIAPSLEKLRTAPDDPAARPSPAGQIRQARSERRGRSGIG